MKQLAISGVAVATVWILVAAWALTERPSNGARGEYGDVAHLRDEPGDRAPSGGERSGIYVIDRDGLPRSAVRGGLGILLRGYARFDGARIRVGARGIRAGLFLTCEGWLLAYLAAASAGAVLGALAARSAETLLGLLAAALGGAFVVGVLFVAREWLIVHDLRAQIERPSVAFEARPREAPPPSPPSRIPVAQRLATELSAPEPIAVAPGIEESDDAGVEGGIEGGVSGGVLGGVLGGVPGSAPSGEGQPILRVGGAVLAPARIGGAAPVYTDLARQARIQGIVILEAVIDERGSVGEVRVLRGLPAGLDEAAVEAVRSWQFRPATLDGRPVPVYFTLTLNFRLD